MLHNGLFPCTITSLHINVSALGYMYKLNKVSAGHGKKEVNIMCMYLSNGNFLGQRLIGYDFYDSKTRGFVGMTEKQVITKLKNKEKVYGFVLGEEDGKEVLKLDAEGFNMSNLQLKTGVNSLSWMNEDDGSDMNMELIVVAVSGDKKKIFETVNARHARVEYTEDKLKMMLELGVPVAGVKLEKNKLVACEGVEIISNEEEVKEGA